jgi:hypothetical protein
VGYLRRKLGEPIIEAIRGAGYCLQVQGQAAPRNGPDRTGRRDHMTEDGLTPTPEHGWVTQPQRPPDSGSRTLRPRPQVRHVGTGKRKYPISSAAHF